MRSPIDESAEQQPGLRERRRLATASEINEAALRLFETRGVEGTTVADIAQAAGVSQRTFFRYFESKELAALADLGWADVLERWAAGEPEPEEDTFASMLEMLERGLRVVSGPDSRDHLLRMRRVADKEPSVRFASLRAGIEHTETLARALRTRGRGRYSELEVLALSRFASTAVDAAVDHWKILAETGKKADLVEVFRDVCRITRRELPQD